MSIFGYIILFLFVIIFGFVSVFVVCDSDMHTSCLKLTHGTDLKIVFLDVYVAVSIRRRRHVPSLLISKWTYSVNQIDVFSFIFYRVCIIIYYKSIRA